MFYLVLVVDVLVEPQEALAAAQAASQAVRDAFKGVLQADALPGRRLSNAEAMKFNEIQLKSIANQ